MSKLEENLGDAIVEAAKIKDNELREQILYYLGNAVYNLSEETNIEAPSSP